MGDDDLDLGLGGGATLAMGSSWSLDLGALYEVSLGSGSGSFGVDVPATGGPVPSSARFDFDPGGWTLFVGLTWWR